MTHKGPISLIYQKLIQIRKKKKKRTEKWAKDMNRQMADKEKYMTNTYE